MHYMEIYLSIASHQ